MQLNFCRKGCCRRSAFKILMVMKLIIFLVTVTCLQVSATTYAQRVTLSETNAPLSAVFSSIQQQSGYQFFYKGDLLGNTRVSIDVKDVTVKEALEQLLKDQPLSYTITDNIIVIRRKTEPAAEKRSPPSDVIGRVTNKAGQPLNGATVTIKRTQEGTLTDANGNFTIRGVLSTDTLVVSYLGYQRQFIGVGENKDFKIVLNETSNKLDEVVIQAYGETSQRLATGNIGTVTAKDIEKQPVMNALGAIQGEVPGAVVTNKTGYASGNVNIEIRGRATLSNLPSNPLYIIDGVPLTISDIYGSSNYTNGPPGITQSGLTAPAVAQSPLFSLNPDDIESIAVLKDADATAIYGSRGANGVVLITTKKGNAGKTTTSINVSQGVSKITERYQLLNTGQYIAMREQALKNDGLPVNINNSPDLVTGDPSRYTNWENYLWGGIGNYTDADLTLAGGNTQTTFRLSAGFQDKRDVTTVSGNNERASLSLNLDHKSLNQRLDVNIKAQYSYAVTDQISEPGSPNMSPNAPAVYDKNGNLNFEAWDEYYGYSGANPFGNLLQPYSANTNFLNADLTLKYEIVKGLTFNTNFGYSNFQNLQSQFYPIISQDPAYNPTGSVDFGSTLNATSIIEPHFEYNKVIGKGKFNALVGTTMQISYTTSTLEGGTGYQNDAELQNIAAAPVKSSVEFQKGAYKYTGAFLRLNYNWEDKWIVDLNGRRDGSSRFGPGHQFGNFGSAGVAYIFSEERWFKDHLSFLSLGKLRGSFGTTGSDPALNYMYLTQWNFGQFPYNGQLPLTPIKHTDSLFHWQVNKKAEIALNLGFLKDRILFNVAYYLNRVSDELIFYPTPEFTGFTNVFENFPAVVENRGFEFELTAKVLDQKDFRWNVHLNLGVNRNKLFSFPGLAQSPYANTYIVGQPLNIVRVLHYTGVDPQTGLYTFNDKNHDGQVTYNPSNHNTDDTYPLDLSPKFDGGFTNTISYRNWELSAFFYFRKQLGYNAFGSLDVPGDVSNQPLEILNSVWQRPGQVAGYAKLTTNPGDQSYNNFYFNSDGIYTDASFIRLQNLTLSYSLPKKGFLKGISNGNVFLRGQNLFVLTKYKGPDPEIQSFSSLPLPLTITTGISITF